MPCEQKSKIPAPGFVERDHIISPYHCGTKHDTV